jgi:hypothetical protein
VIVRGKIDAELASMLGVEPTFLPWYAAATMVALGAVLGATAVLASMRRLVAV